MEKIKKKKCRGNRTAQRRRYKERYPEKVHSQRRARRKRHRERLAVLRPPKVEKLKPEKKPRATLGIPYPSDTKEYAMAYYQLVKDRRRQQVNEWRKTNPERMRALRNKRRGRETGGRNFTYQDVLDILRQQKSMCVYCRENIKNDYQIDHIMPLSRNGENSKNNIQLLCPSCNARKSNKHPVDFAMSIGLLV